MNPPPQFTLHLFQGPHEDQKIGNGHGLFSLQNLKEESALLKKLHVSTSEGQNGAGRKTAHCIWAQLMHAQRASRD